MRGSLFVRTQALELGLKDMAMALEQLPLLQQQEQRVRAACKELSAHIAAAGDNAWRFARKDKSQLKHLKEEVARLRDAAGELRAFAAPLMEELAKRRAEEERERLRNERREMLHRHAGSASVRALGTAQGMCNATRAKREAEEAARVAAAAAARAASSDAPAGPRRVPSALLPPPVRAYIEEEGLALLAGVGLNCA